MNDHYHFMRDGMLPIGTNELEIPDILITQFDCDPAQKLKPVLDAFWNAGGLEGSMSYDEAGRWKPR